MISIRLNCIDASRVSVAARREYRSKNVGSAPRNDVEWKRFREPYRIETTCGRPVDPFFQIGLSAHGFFRQFPHLVSEFVVAEVGCRFERRLLRVADIVSLRGGKIQIEQGVEIGEF